MIDGKKDRKLDLAFLAGSFDVSAMFFRNSFCDGKAQPIVIAFAVSGFVNPVESIE